MHAATAPALTIYLCRHGDTAWSPTRRLAGRTDLPLVEQGEANARQLGVRLQALTFDRVLVSPLGRARRTAELAGFAARAVVDERLIEIDFGVHDGSTVAEVRRTQPGWTYLRDGCPGGETADDVGRRVDAVLAEQRALGGTLLVFGHSVVLRVLAARFLGWPPGHARNLMMAPASLGVVTFDPVDDSPAISAWNDQQHLATPWAPA
jgi:broad specificity phosphatase PhoE